MRTHLALYLALHHLSGEQQKVILEAISLATPALYELRPGGRDRQSSVKDAQGQFRNRIDAVFLADEAATIFSTLGAVPQH